jgi:hypothetical protein
MGIVDFFKHFFEILYETLYELLGPTETEEDL